MRSLRPKADRRAASRSQPEWVLHTRVHDFLFDDHGIRIGLPIGIIGIAIDLGDVGPTRIQETQVDINLACGFIRDTA